MSKKIFGIINTPKTATNDEKHFFGAQNTPVFDIPMFNFQPNCDDMQLSATKTISSFSSSRDLLKDGERIHSRRNSVSDSEQLDDIYSGAPLKLADPHEHRVKRRHHSGGSHLSDVSPQQPIVASVELKTTFENDDLGCSRTLLDSLENSSVASDLNSTTDLETTTGSSFFTEKTSFDDHDDDVTSVVDFDLMDNEELNGSSALPDAPKGGKKTRGRVKINIELIKDKERRSTTFSKRKNGILKKAKELAVLTGAQVMLLIASETGHVYSYATDKLKPIVQGTEGEQLVLSCLKTAQDNPRSDKQSHSKPIKMEVIPSLPTETVNGTVNSFKSRLDNSFAQSKINRKRKLEELRDMRHDANKSVPLPNTYHPTLQQQSASDLENSHVQMTSSNTSQQITQNGLQLQAPPTGKNVNKTLQYQPVQNLSSRTVTPQIFITNQPTVVSQQMIRATDHQIQSYPSAGILDSAVIARNGTIQRTTASDSNLLQAFVNNSLLHNNSQQGSALSVASNQRPSSVNPTPQQQQYFVASSSSSSETSGLPNAVNLTTLPTVHSVHSISDQIPRIKEEFSPQTQIVTYPSAVDTTGNNLVPAATSNGGLISVRHLNLDHISSAAVAANLVSNNQGTTVAFPVTTATNLQVIGAVPPPPRIRSVPPVSNNHEAPLSPTRS